MFMKTILSIIIITLFSISGIFAYSICPPSDTIITTKWQKSKHPAVFLIQQESDAFEELSMRYENNLIAACNNDMDSAYSNWITMLKEMERFADDRKFDIKGVKMWIKIFWSNDGTLDHVAYFLKPTSRNINTDALTIFFKDFVRFYRFPVETEFEFSHYASASFPIYTPK